MVVVTVILVALFVAQAIMGVQSANIVSDRIGLAFSDHCGIWQFDEDAGEDAANRADLEIRTRKLEPASTQRHATHCRTNPTPCRAGSSTKLTLLTKSIRNNVAHLPHRKCVTVDFMMLLHLIPASLMLVKLESITQELTNSAVRPVALRSNV